MELGKRQYNGIDFSTRRVMNQAHTVREEKVLERIDKEIDSQTSTGLSKIPLQKISLLLLITNRKHKYSNNCTEVEALLMVENLQYMSTISETFIPQKMQKLSLPARNYNTKVISLRGERDRGKCPGFEAATQTEIFGRAVSAKRKLLRQLRNLETSE